MNKPDLRKLADHTGYGCAGTERIPGISDSLGPILELEQLSVAFRDHLIAAGLSRVTIDCYLSSVKLFGSHLRLTEYEGSVRDVSVADLRLFSIRLLDRFAENTVNRHVVGIRQFFAFLEVNGVIEVSPARNLAPPSLRLQRVRILNTGDLKRLLQACSGGDFVDRRDLALFRIFMATGARPDEVLGLRIGKTGTRSEDVDLERAMVVLRSPNGQSRACPLDPKTVNCLRRYRRARSGHINSFRPELWLTHLGGLTRAGLNAIVRGRNKKAGLKRATLHAIRSTFAHRWLASGGNEGDLMRLLGIADRRTIDRYAESVASSTATRNASAMFHTSGDQYDSQYATPK